MTLQLERRRLLVYIPGCWDVLHVGHLNILNRAKAYGDILVVGVQSDDSVEEEKGKAPSVPLVDRIRMLEALEVVDFALPYYNYDYKSHAEAIDAGVLVFGPSHTKDRHLAVEAWMRETGRRVIRLPRTDGVSSTSIKEGGESV